MRLAIVVALAACGSPPPPKPPPAELEVVGPASVAGSYVTDDDMDFGYALELTAAGGYTLVIDRGKLGRCEQSGTLVAGADTRHYALTYARNTCEPDLVGTLALTITSFTASALVITLTTGDGTATRRTYGRRPQNV